MAVDETSLERIRKASFPQARRGYDKREVEKFLNRLADWLETGGGDQARSDTVRRELERVGERTGSILAEAEESAQQIRSEAEQEAEELKSNARAEADQARKEAESYAAEARATADTYSKETRAEADAYSDETRRAAEQHAKEVRTEAESDAREMVAGAEAQAQRTVDEGVTRRRDVEAVISDLAGRRDDVIADMQKLSDALKDKASEHKPASAAADPFATPSSLDPLEREGEDQELDDELDRELEADLDADAQTEIAVEEDGDTGEAEAEERPQQRRGGKGKKAASKSKS
jgi:DivIVA domain-containing protein